MFYVPLELINGVDFHELYGVQWTFWVNFTYAFFLTDIIIKFNTGVYEKGMILTSRKDIAKHYLSDQFIRDILALTP